MSTQSNDFFKRLLETYKVEAEEHLTAISSGLLELEKNPAADIKQNLLETVMREAHSLKGASRAVNMFDAASVCQSLENVLSAVKKGRLNLTVDMYDLLHQTVDSLTDLILKQSGESDDQLSEHSLSFIENLEALLAQNQEKSSPGTVNTFTPEPEVDVNQKIEAQTEEIKEKYSASKSTVRIAASKLDSLLLQIEELLNPKLTYLQRTSELREILAEVLRWQKELAKYQSILNNSEIEQLNKFWDWNSGNIGSVNHKLNLLLRNIKQDNYTLDIMINNLLDDIKKVMLVPFSYLFDLFPKAVRELSRSLGKEVTLKIAGDNLEIDRRILDELRDPLIHIIRNSVDHGIETPETRKSKGKPETGTISISIDQKGGNKIEIIIEDDGRGIDPESAFQSALRNKIVTKDEAEKLTEQEKLMLIFQSGVSTSEIITDISGRGLGLAIVKEKIEKLGGTLSLQSTYGKGTKFSILLPLSFATIRGLIVRVKDSEFVIPTFNVEKAVRINRKEISTVENKEIIQIDKITYPFIELSKALGLSGNNRAAEDENIIVLLLSALDKKIALKVDSVLYEQEVLVKNLGKQLIRMKNIAGATVLGSGKIAPVINAPDLIKSTLKAPSSIKAKDKAAAKPQDVKPILVVEDSITARTLLKNILDTAGYKVKTAVDGIDALTALKTEEFSLVISDVEMPRMNGFDLTAKIRSEKNLSDLPVILVTSMGSQEHREKGIDAGANAYIVKSSFDQGNLLEAIRRFI
jgi:two-component system chemotaxis sensor kinase CheA